MKPLDLQLLGVPEKYREQNPFQLNQAQLLDAYPSRAHASAVNIWMRIRGDSQSLPHVAWQDLLSQFVRGCESIGLTPFLLPTDRRNHDEHVRNFLQPYRRRVRDYLDRLKLVTLPVWEPQRDYQRFENSWWLTSALKLYKFRNGLDIGRTLHEDYRWTKTFYPKYPATQTWHRWILWGVCRVGWSANSSNCWLWYEIRCPELPGASGNYRDQDATQFNKHVDDLWLPLVHNIRWWSTSNPRTWDF